MADNEEGCEGYFTDCSKTELTWAMFWKRLITKTGPNDCPAIRVKTDISLDVEELNVNMADVEALLTILNSLVGEVQANPTANTVQDRLKTIATLLTTLNTYVDGVETAIGTTNTTLTTIAGYLDNVEALLAAATPAGENHIGEVGGNLISVAVEKTRPGNTNAYIAGDVINESTSAGTVFTFSNLARKNDGTGYITKARLMTDQKANTARYRVHLFHTAPTAIFDNVPNTTLYADFRKKIGHFDLPAMSTSTDSTNSTGATTFDLGLRIPFKSVSGERTIFAVLETLDGFNPANAQKYHLELTADNN